jgi:hypothetical protein
VNTVLLQDVPNQSILTTLSNQQCQLNVYQKRTGLFMDIYANDFSEPILAGVYCVNQVFCIMDAYLGFVGDFMWVDTLGQNANPYYGGGLGSRFQLVYLAPSDIPSTALFAGAESAEQVPAPQ